MDEKDAIRASVSRPSIEKRDEAVIAEAEDRVLAHDEFTPKEYSRLMRKVDFILMPMLMILYGLQYSDKTSLSSGVVFGLKEDTGLTTQEFANLTSFFYMSYAVAQYPMAYLLQKFPLGRALAVCTILWGSMVMCLGACNTYAQLAAVRVWLGWFESVVTPGFAIFTASWYLRKEQGLRQGMYYAMNSFFAMVFGLGIYFIADAQARKGGLAAWRVINLFLGAITVGMGFIFLVFGGTPDEVWWLSKREKRMAKARIVENATGSGEQAPWRWDQVRECLVDPQYWCALLFNLLGNIPNGALTTFQNLIYKGFGFTSLETVLYSLPMYGVTFVCVILCAVTVRYFPRMRFPVALIVQAVCVFVLLFAGLANVGKWAKWGVWMFSLVYSIGSFILAWPMISVNVAGRTKKSFFGATSLLVYCVGNIIGSQVMRPSDGPKYLKGLTVCAVVQILCMVNTCVWWWHYARQNRKRDAELAVSGMTEEERKHQNQLAGSSDLTDIQNQHFRYMC
ncbi:hypothetical protein CcaverHIS002_0204900 [Cutaneotrichosporon cavernicola]|uniref:MFS general substrate transporter n=1 Tax=Cutaneotrichosporon cavernicola TaxID=279322 RepID=A0AA48I0T4_9TREE|nr:uncharacterized protein CcaverHIS019_0204860 [Cutaneotrichosporon cavernicola]BEI81330.1 hypothetical protein CcaverHIS002_0204900 [Cutaneotrichosporon cavernicola]BEI89124.1 hypothetical protein CcaverHIS019_0204860 [Cutaneotrichosporon cavernicola]BEI96901.1 hypothetical protein CcaverHIS631_0204900 [Cutaneotrichosporon cavernicola]BEJ04673.1 hypothetical protein CcaverHIS641_0204900 [Cutaneotrichosporon cavernicola]